MKKSLRKEILSWFEKEKVLVLFIDKIKENCYKVKVFEEDYNNEIVEKLKEDGFNVKKVKNSSYCDLFSKVESKCKSLFIEKEEEEKMLNIEDLNEVIRKINRDEEKDEKVIDFFIKLQDLLNDVFDNEVLMELKKELEYLEY